MKKSLIVILSFLFTACTNPFGNDSKFGSSFLGDGGSGIPVIFSGSLFGLVSTSGVGTLSAPTCTNPRVQLYKLSGAGEQENSPSASVAIASDGTYKILETDISNYSSVGKYIVEVTGCAEPYGRLLTGSTDQVISPATSLVAWVSRTSASVNLLTAPLSSVENLYSRITYSSVSVADAFADLDSNPDLKNEFQTVLGISVPSLAEAAPRVEVTSGILVPSEGIANTYSLNVSHWSSGYTPFYIWKLDGSILAQGTNLTSRSLTFTANQQGPHVLTVQVGRNNAGSLDGSKPSITKSWTLTVPNNLPATVPALTLTSNAVSNSRTVTFDLDTGTSRVNCSSFTSLAITENMLVAPGSGAFTESCITASTQSFSHTVSSGDGVKTLRVWALDAAGNISLSSQSVVMTLDQTNPDVIFAGAPSVTNGAFTVNVTFSENVTGLSASDFTVTNGSVTLLTGSGASYVATVTPSIASGASGITVLELPASVVADAAGNDNDASNTLSVSVDKVAPVVTLARSSSSASPTNSGSLTLDVTVDKSVIGLHSSDFSVTNGTVSSVSGSGTTYTVVITNGIAGGSSGTVSVQMNASAVADSAGNTNAASNVVTWSVDRVGPNIALTTLNGGQKVRGSSAVYTASSSIAWTATEANPVANPYTLEYSTNSGSTWLPIAANLSASPYAWTLPQFDSTNTRIRLTAVDALGNQSTVTSGADILVDNGAPTLTSFRINNDSISTSSPFVTTQASASDGHSSSLQVRLANAHQTTNECQSEYADTGWMTLTSSTAWTLTAGDGEKIVCAWVKDEVGNVSVQSPVTGTSGINMDSISFYIGNPPIVNSFTVSNNSDGSRVYSTGSVVKIDWNVTDQEGLANNPITIEYTYGTSGVWYDVVRDFGGLSGNPLSYVHSSTSWTVPSTINNAYFQLRITAKDKAGNTSVRTLSEPQNTGRWNVLVGTKDRGVGSNGMTLALKNNWGGYQAFAFHPTKNDLYVIDGSTGVIKVNAQTGETSYLFTHGTTNISYTGGAFPTDPKVDLGGSPVILFDKNNYLYLRVGNSIPNSSHLLQIDLENHTSKIYIGADASKVSGTVVGSGGTPSTTYVALGGMAFDANNNLYYSALCRGNTSSSSTDKFLLMKATQNSSTKAADTISVVGGDCTKANANPTSGQSATDQSLGSNGQANRFSVAAVGNAVYYINGNNVYKIIGGISYTTTIPAVTRYSLMTDGTSIITTGSSSGQVANCTTNDVGADGETCTNLTSATQAANCADEGQSASSACVYALQFAFNSQGRIVFGDNGNDQSSDFRVRYFDAQDKIRTLAGSLPFYGDGKHRLLARGIFSSIYYKQASEGNQSAFPAGLYFTVDSGPVFARVKSDENIDVIWGNQNPAGSVYATGVDVSKSTSMLNNAGYSSRNPLTFDETGLPWLIYAGTGALVSLDANKKIVARTLGSNDFDGISAGSNTTAASIRYGASKHGLIAKDNNAYVLGASWITGAVTTNQYPMLRRMDFSVSPALARAVTGGTGTTFGGELTTAGNITSISMGTPCQGNGVYCSMDFFENNAASDTDDQIFYNEGAAVRVITNPKTPTSATLVNVFTAATNINNIKVSPNKKRIFFIASDGRLYCHSIASADITSWCPQSGHTSLGPPTGMDTIARNPNPMAFKDDDTLYISSGTSGIYEYLVPNGVP